MELLTRTYVKKGKIKVVQHEMHSNPKKEGRNLVHTIGEGGSHKKKKTTGPLASLLHVSNSSRRPKVGS